MTRVVPPLQERHAPMILLDAFYEAIEAFDEWSAGDSEPTVRYDGKDVPVSSIFGRMRTSEDLASEKVRLSYAAAASIEPSRIDARNLINADIATHMRELCLERLRDSGTN